VVLDVDTLAELWAVWMDALSGRTNALVSGVVGNEWERPDTFNTVVEVAGRIEVAMKTQAWAGAVTHTVTAPMPIDSHAGYSLFFEDTLSRRAQVASFKLGFPTPHVWLDIEDVQDLRANILAVAFPSLTWEAGLWGTGTNRQGPPITAVGQDTLLMQVDTRLRVAVIRDLTTVFEPLIDPHTEVFGTSQAVVDIVARVSLERTNGFLIVLLNNLDAHEAFASLFQGEVCVDVPQSTVDDIDALHLFAEDLYAAAGTQEGSVRDGAGRMLLDLQTNTPENPLPDRQFTFDSAFIRLAIAADAYAGGEVQLRLRNGGQLAPACGAMIGKDRKS